MKKLHALAFYALITPTIALGSATLLAAHHGSEDKDVGEQEMDSHAEKGKQSSERHEESTKSKYNTGDPTGKADEMDPKKGDHSDMKKKDKMKNPSADNMTEKE
ncbi:hypothetical protein [Marinobacter sp. S0848L]|uniref:hypothetical protein n=1 Tax=Marinobacter sp. S0848L TaxID=2926423 RepID=UPI001FF1EC3E|nr:hypothetical protein [Marinobacter sp. S0848L]MCK0104805.1 hypothetical protein [Marinobacter sp. S0848L]